MLVSLLSILVNLMNLALQVIHLHGEVGCLQNLSIKKIEVPWYRRLLEQAEEIWIRNKEIFSPPHLKHLCLTCFADFGLMSRYTMKWWILCNYKVEYHHCHLLLNVSYNFILTMYFLFKLLHTDNVVPGSVWSVQHVPMVASGWIGWYLWCYLGHSAHWRVRNEDTVLRETNRWKSVLVYDYYRCQLFAVVVIVEFPDW